MKTHFHKIYSIYGNCDTDLLRGLEVIVLFADHKFVVDVALEVAQDLLQRVTTA